MQSDVVVGSGHPVTAKKRKLLRPGGAPISLYVSTALVGLVQTRLRVVSPSSLDAVYRVIETSSLGTLTRKRFWFCRENQGIISSAVPAYLAHYKVPGSLSAKSRASKQLRRRSMVRLIKALDSDVGKRGVEILLGGLSEFAKSAPLEAKRAFARELAPADESSFSVG